MAGTTLKQDSIEPTSVGGRHDPHNKAYRKYITVQAEKGVCNVFDNERAPRSQPTRLKLIKLPLD